VDLGTFLKMNSLTIPEFVVRSQNEKCGLKYVKSTFHGGQFGL
jgi:hypothetical protein